MLERLDAIDWSKLSHAYGEASDVPSLIRALTSDDEETRQEAVSELFSNIYHQGTIYKATPHAVPFLIELLEVDSVQVKADILALLSAIATGTSYLDVRQDDDRFISERGTESFAAELAFELDCVRRSHEAVTAGTPVFLSLLSDANAEVRMWSLHTLGTCAAQAEAIEMGLWLWYNTETYRQVKASMMLCLRDLWQPQAHSASNRLQPNQAQLQRILEVMRYPYESGVVRFCAALTLMSWLDGETLEEAISLAEQLADMSWPSIASLPWIAQASGPLDAITSGFKHRHELLLRFLLDLLRNPNREVCTDAISRLEDLCQERRSPTLQVAPALGELLSDPDPEVRWWAAMTLAKIGSAARLATEPLLAALDDPDARVRGESAVALAKVREGRAIPRIRELLHDAETSAKALEALERFGPMAAEAIPDLILMLQRPLEELTLNDLTPPFDERQMAALTAHGESDKVLRALGAIGSAGEQGLDEVAAMLHGPLVSTAAWVLGHWGPSVKRVMPELIASLDSPPALRNAVRALGNIGAPAAAIVARLVEMLERAAPLLKIKTEAFRTANVFGMGPAALITEVAIALRKIDQSELSIPALIGLIETELDGENNLLYTCTVAIDYLGEIGAIASSACAILRKALTHKTGGVRISAAYSLWRIARSVDEVLPVLIRELRSLHNGMDAIECLSAMGPAARPALPELRRIIEADERIVQSGGVDELIDRDEALCEAAQKAVKNIA